MFKPPHAPSWCSFLAFFIPTPSLSIPVLKCWPSDWPRFPLLPTPPSNAFFTLPEGCGILPPPGGHSLMNKCKAQKDRHWQVWARIQGSPSLGADPGGCVERQTTLENWLHPLKREIHNHGLTRLLQDSNPANTQPLEQHSQLVGHDPFFGGVSNDHFTRVT